MLIWIICILSLKTFLICKQICREKHRDYVTKLHFWFCFIIFALMPHKPHLEIWLRMYMFMKNLFNYEVGNKVSVWSTRIKVKIKWALYKFALIFTDDINEVWVQYRASKYLKGILCQKKFLNCHSNISLKSNMI